MDYYEFCKKCIHYDFNLKQGILCKLSNEKPSFVENCDKFELNSAKDETQSNQEKNLYTQDKSKLVSDENSIYSKIQHWFYDPDEKFIGTLGQGYLASIIQGDFSKSVLVLTNKRIYQKGKIFEIGNTGSLQSVKADKVIEVDQVTGTSFYERNMTKDSSSFEPTQ